MCNYWTNFARTGNPNGLDCDGTPLPEWKAARIGDWHVQLLSDEIKDIPGGPDPVLRFEVKHMSHEAEHERETTK